MQNSYLNLLLNKYEIPLIEKHLIYIYINNIDLDFSKSPLLKDYFINFTPNPSLFLESSILNIKTIKELEKHLELLIPSNDRKVNGAFFTPNYIIDFIINKINPKRTDKNFDPSCGCGAFLIGLVEFYKKKYNKKINEILRENIFGVDILNYNIHRSKILLSIYALQNDEIINEDNFNLVVADSLRAKWENLFNNNNSVYFDNIVGNPPYVKFQDLSDENREFLINNYQTIKKGTFNIYFAFFELGYNLLKNNGNLGFITPNNYFTSLAGESLRKFFQNKKCIKSIVDFNHKKVFSAQTYTAITFLNKNENTNIYYDRINSGQEPEIFLNNIETSPVNINDLNIKKWRLLKSDEKTNIKLIESVGLPLNKLVNISVGIATLKDELYFLDSTFIDNNFYQKFIDNRIFNIEPEIVKSIYKISDFNSQEESNSNTRKIIFPYKIINNCAIPIEESEMTKKYPKCFEYFLYIKDRLKDRDKGKINLVPFYSYGRSQGLTIIGKKLLTPTFSKHPKFMLINDERSLFCNGYGIYYNDNKESMSLFDDLINPFSKADNIRLLQKILNSIVMHYYITRTSVSIAGGYPCYQKNFIERFTIPYFSKQEINYFSSINDNKEINEFLINKYQLNISSLNLSE